MSESQFWKKWLICVLLKNIWSSGRHSFHPQLHYIHQNAQWLPWVIWNQRLNLFNDCGLRDAFFRVTLSRILEPSLDCSKAVYKALEQSKNSHNIINGWSPKNQIISYYYWARRPSMIMALRLYSALGFNITAILKIWIRLSRTPTTIFGGGTI